ncbi:MAG: phosphotransferase [Candidatus Taylorbacteria bacterium]|nr:phosphotransferase [Candidatus Taylorbacteria bacterium]
MSEELLIGHFNAHEHEHNIHPELLPEKVDEAVRSLIKNLLETQRNKIGYGLSAEVHYPVENPGLCFKIISFREASGRHIPPPRVPITTEKSPSDSRDGYLEPDKEGEFLDELCDERDLVIVPEPCCWAKYEAEFEGDTYFSKESLMILAMERLNAVSIKEVLEGDKELPESFDINKFFLALRTYLYKIMHNKGIHHRDLHEGNIMIDIESGKPCIIDFGKSSYGSSEDVYTFEFNDRGHVKQGEFTHDEDFVDEIEQKIIRFLADSRKN